VCRTRVAESSSWTPITKSQIHSKYKEMQVANIKMKLTKYQITQAKYSESMENSHIMRIF
jgi:hypothetical protein